MQEIQPYGRSLSGPLEALDLLEALGGRDRTRCPFLLASDRGFAEAGRFSYLGIDPTHRLIIEGDCAYWETPEGKETWQGNAFDLLERALSTQQQSKRSEGPVPFTGGWIVALSYDLAHAVEELPSSVCCDQRLPQLVLQFYPQIYACDHQTNRWYAFGLAEAEEAAQKQLDRMEADFAAAQAQLNFAAKDSARLNIREALQSTFERQAYESAVQRAIDYIRAGDIFQVNLSQRFELPCAAEPLDLYRALHQANPAPYGGMLAWANQAIISSSPELFLRLRNRQVETHPIKGTRPRGTDPEEDKHLRQALLDSEKEQSELAMITDLLRNDIGRVCEYGSVHVAEPRRLNSYRTVHHTESVVRGRLREPIETVDLLRACWPGGSISGAPKIRAMEIIDELEPTSRSFYTGSLGWIAPNGDMELNILIRTMLLDGPRLTFQVGGGIVADSNPAAEYEETLHKAEGLFRALEQGYSLNSGEHA